MRKYYTNSINVPIKGLVQAFGAGIDFERFKLVVQGFGQSVLIGFAKFLHGVKRILPGSLHGMQKGLFLSASPATSKLRVILFVMARRSWVLDTAQNGLSNLGRQLFQRRSIADWSRAGVVGFDKFQGHGRTRRFCSISFFIGRGIHEVWSSRTKSCPILLRHEHKNELVWKVPRQAQYSTRRETYLNFTSSSRTLLFVSSSRTLLFCGLLISKNDTFQTPCLGSR